MSKKVRGKLHSLLEQGFVLPLFLLLILLAASAVIFGIIKFSTRSQAATEHPNIVVIMTDDQRWDTVDWMPVVKSKLAGQGVTFTNGYVTDSLCCPSRASFLTGLYAHNHGVRTNTPPNGGAEVFKDGSTIATWLKSAGYKTSWVGKYMNGYENLSAGYIPPGWDDWHAWAGGGPYYSYKFSENGTVNTLGSGASAYSTDVFKDRAVKFIENQAASTQPFFLTFAPFAPHANGNYPTVPKAAPRHTCETLALHRPPSFNEADVSDKPNWVKNIALMDSTKITNLDKFRNAQVCSLKAIDEAVDALITALGPKLDNTMIVFTTDNAFMWGEHRVTRKNCEFEECAHVPMIIRYPKLVPLPTPTPTPLPSPSPEATDSASPLVSPSPSPSPALTAPATIDKFVLNIDLPVTFTELAGITPPAKVNGKSLVPLLTDPATAAWRTDFLMEYDNNNYIVRNKDWMYAELAGGGRELYDMVNDPYQLVSQHANSAFNSIKTELAARLAQLKAE